jgi:hypothetical protein
MPETPRRFPPPWSVEELDACYVVRDNSGQKLSYVYFEEPGWDCGKVSHQTLGVGLMLRRH